MHVRTTRVGTQARGEKVGISWVVPKWDLLLSALQNFMGEIDVVINTSVESRVTFHPSDVTNVGDGSTLAGL